MAAGILRIAPIVLFLALLCLPLAQGATHFLPEKPLEEYRALAQLPSVEELKGGSQRPEQFVDALSKWHSDNFPTRPFWVRLRTQVEFSLFRTSDQVHVGKDGYLFYRSELDTQIPANERLTDAEIADIVEAFGSLSQQLEQRNVTLIVVPLLEKHNYYPEYLPDTAANARNFHRINAVFTKLAADQRINLLDTRAMLRAAKRDGLQVFHRTDFHWTDPAGALVARELTNRFGALEGKPQAGQLLKWDIKPLEMSGGQARFLPLFAPPTEHSVQLAQVAPTPKNDLTLPPPAGVETFLRNSGDGAQLAPIFVYGDSYFDALERSGFQNNFSVYVRGRFNQNKIVDAFMARAPGTQYMVLEFIEVALVGAGKEAATLGEFLASPGGQ